MSDFTGVSKHLGLVPARVATLDEAKSAPQPFDKYYSRIPARKIGTFNSLIHLPAFTSNLNISYVGQVNFTLPQDFYLKLINWDLISLTMAVAVRYRVGTTVTRYLLGNKNVRDQFGFYYGLQAPLYFHQLIKKNFVIEFWRTSLAIGGTANSNDIKLETSLVELPADSSQLVGTTYEGAAYTRITLPRFNFPEPIPTHYTNDQWLDNV